MESSLTCPTCEREFVLPNRHMLNYVRKSIILLLPLSCFTPIIYRMILIINQFLVSYRAYILFVILVWKISISEQ